MAINFSNINLVKISCDQVCDDNHNVQNLISSDDQTRLKGFLVEYYIRPPINVKIEFLRNFDLFCINLGLKVRQHQVRGIEVFTQTSSCDNLQLIAKCFNAPETWTIVNNCYKSSRHLPPCSSSIPENAFYVAGRNIRHCININCILIKIFSTINSTVPGLSHLDLYGKPNGMYNEEMRHFYSLLSVPKGEPITNSVTSKQRSVTSNDISQQIEHLAPLEFFDSLTNELMRTPYSLPSGKNIDKTTLNKYLATKKDLNQINDPFTMIPFNEQSKPILNTELKARIDLFFSSNGQSELDRKNDLRKRLLNIP